MTARETETAVIRKEGRLRIFALALLIAVALHFLPMFIFTPLKSTPEREQTDRRFTVMVNNVPSAQYDPFDLYYWLKYENPVLFAEPDYDTGFSAWQRERRARLETEDASRPLQLSLTGPIAFPKNQYDFTPRTPEKLLPPLAIRMPFRLAAPARPEKRTTTFPKWTAADGTDLGALFPDGDQIRALVARKEPKHATVLLLTPGRVPELPPTIKVGRSSGSPELDMRAAGALAAFAGSDENRPMLKKLKYVIVDWGNVKRSPQP